MASSSRAVASPAQAAISAKTQLCVIIGDPVAHSLSPLMHNVAYRAVGRQSDFVYVASRVRKRDLRRAVGGFRSMGLRGLTCTIPHKTDILPLLDQLDPIAAQIGAVNTVVQEDGKLIGYNTDWLGVVEPLRRVLSFEGKRFAILGAGGTARAAMFGLVQAGAKSILILNRTLAKAEALAREIGAEAAGLEQVDALASCDVILNTTAVGMKPLADRSPIPASALRPTHLVMDAIYTPFTTRLLEDASSVGARVIRGAQMFLEQGVAQYALYTGEEAPREVMQAVVCQHFGVEAL